MDEIFEVSRSDYPTLLCELPDPPKQLYARGRLPHINHTLLCVVGSRQHTSYGSNVCSHLITGLEGLPITIISGLALGIDTLAHKAALKAGLQTIAVPGSGISDPVLYPTSNKHLAHTIIENGGGLLSEFDPHFRATKWSFPKRNRIMSGMSHATLVIEASLKSGTLITSRCAGEYNRDVLTVPGPIFSEQSVGPHKLIQDGAVPITSIEDLKTALGFESVKENKKYKDCTPHEILLLEILQKPQTRAELLGTTTLTEHDVRVALNLLEIKGYVKEAYGKIYLL